MIHARRDYDRIQDPDGKIPLDEPVFLIRGQDPIGAEVVRYWLQRYCETTQGSNAVLSKAGKENLVKAIVIHADKMEHWADNVQHGPATINTNQMRLF